MRLRKNIWFLCPACERRLVVDREAGGCRADCPECGATIPIPRNSTITPPWIKTFAVSVLQGAVLVVCVVLGWWWAAGGTQGPAAVPASHEADAPAGQETAREASAENPAAVTDAPLRDSEAENRALLTENREIQGRYNKLLQWMMDNYRGKYPLPEDMVGRLRIKPLAADNALNPELAELLNMSTQERELVQDIFDYVKGALTQTELSRATITEQDLDTITITVPSYAEVGGELREDLYLTLESTLGAPRFDRMVDVSGTDMREQFNYFGEASRTLTFEVIYPEYEGQHEPYVLISDGWVVPEGESSRVTKITETAINELPESYRAYQPMLPDEVSRYASP